VQPVLTPEQMRHVDANSGVSFDVLVERAGHAVAHAARLLMGGTYGRRVVVVAGKGNNGADGRIAARRLEERGAHVVVFDAERAPMRLADCDLVIDAAYGTGFRGEYFAPTTRAPILAVDIPSGVDALTGVAHGSPPHATATVTFGALKPGLVLEPGRSIAGEVSVVDIGLDTQRAVDIDAQHARHRRPERRCGMGSAPRGIRSQVEHRCACNRGKPRNVGCGKTRVRGRLPRRSRHRAPFVHRCCG